MNVSVFFTLAVVFSGMMLILQRVQANRRRFVGFLMIPLVVVCWHYARTNAATGSAWLALLVAIGINLLFWLIVGRYNPVAKSEDIRVLKMDD